jgi:predicted permease
MLVSLIPLYLYVLLGMVAGAWLRIESQQIARLAIYLLTPIIIGGFVAQVSFEPSILILPITVFGVASMVALLASLLTGLFISIRPYRPLLSACGGMLNSGYFGISVAGSILGEERVGIYILAIFGLTLFEYTIGVYLINRHVSSPRDSLRQLTRLPGPYACITGLIISAFGIKLPAFLIIALNNLKSTYVVLGMMMLGIVLSSHRASLHIPSTFAALVIRFVIWPLTAWLVLKVDAFTFSFISNSTSQSIVLLLGFLPIGANVIAYAVDSKASPEAIAPAVAISTILSPLILAFVY